MPDDPNTVMSEAARYVARVCEDGNKVDKKSLAAAIQSALRNCKVDIMLELN